MATLNDATREAFEAAVAEVAASTARLLDALPPRRQAMIRAPGGRHHAKRTLRSVQESTAISLDAAGPPPRGTLDSDQGANLPNRVPFGG